MAPPAGFPGPDPEEDKAASARLYGVHGVLTQTMWPALHRDTKLQLRLYRCGVAVLPDECRLDESTAGPPTAVPFASPCAVC
jgi:hypothetical protein